MTFPPADSINALRECPDCGAFSSVPPLAPRTRACCPRCGHVLRRHIPHGLDKALAWTLAGLIFYGLTVTLPFISVSLSGQVRICTLFTGPFELVDDEFFMLGGVVLLFSIVMPLAKLVLKAVLLIGLRLDQPPAFLPHVQRILKQITPWAMVEVYLLGLFIAYTRLVALTKVDLHEAAYALVGLMVCSAAADVATDAETVWSTMDQKGIRYRPSYPVDLTEGTQHLQGCEHCHAVNDSSNLACRRCGGRLHRRKPRSVERCWALLGAAAILYLPANAYTVMTTVKLGHELSHTILGGADELLEAGLWPLALLVFVASILVPMLKFVSLGTMLISLHRRSAWRLRQRTLLYRLISFIGRWSMIDVFMISILVALVQFGKLAQVISGGGIAAFAAVVIVTMFATDVFDPRLMWDAAAERTSAGDEA